MEAARSSADPGVPMYPGMPSFAGMLAASVAGWLVEGPISGLLGPTAGLITSLVVGTFVFYVAKRYVTNLRDGT